jgi:hypothetical protein
MLKHHIFWTEGLDILGSKTFLPNMSTLIITIRPTTNIGL